MRFHVRNRSLLSFLLASAVLSPAAVSAAERATAAQPRLGINLAGPADWNTELPFVDVFRLSRRWISQKEGAGWGKGPELQLDEHGWVKELAPNCWAETPLCTIESGRFPGGEYTVLYDGKGTIEFDQNVEEVSRGQGKMIVRVDPKRGGFFLRVKATDPKDYVRNIRVVMPGFADSYEENPWHPAFLQRWRGVACLRYMDFMHTNNSEISSWEKRPAPADATFTTKGVPLELLIDLANRQKADAWFCMPHKADDEYIRSFAAMVKERLDPELRAYVEYSNEVWNGQFQQHRYAAEQGQKLKLAEKPWEAAWFYTAHRSVEIFTIWEEVFGGTGRLVRVLPSQAANSYISKQIAGYRDAYKHADVVAIAPYLSFNISPSGTPSAQEVAGWPPERVLDHLKQHSLPECTRWIDENHRVADEFGLRLVAYEAGQHMVGIQGAENNDALTNVLKAANAHPQIEKIYASYFEAWEKAGGDLLCYFSSVGQWSKWGSWGLLEYYDEDAAQSPKARAVFHWARSNGHPIGPKKSGQSR